MNNFNNKINEYHNEISWLLVRTQLCIDDLQEELLNSIEPEIENEFDDTPAIKIQYTPIKAIKITVDEHPVSLCVFRAPEYVKEISYKKIRDRWFSLILNYLEKAKRYGEVIPFFDTALVIFNFKFPNDHRVRDPDRFATKFILDAFTWSGVLKDDSFRNVLLIYNGETSDKPSTEIILADIRPNVQEMIEDFIRI